MSGWLTVDLGNSRAKLRAPGPAAAPAAAPASGDSHRLQLERADDPRLGPFLALLAGGTRAAICAVGSEALEAELISALRKALGAEAVIHPDPGVENTCDSPHTTGLDRLFAVRGAYEQLRSDGREGEAGCLVVDAGTALTVDAVRFAGGGGAPRLLGGAIAPGPELLGRALHTGTARLPLVAAEPGAPSLGRDTHGAIRSGISTGFRGAALELVRNIRAESGLGEVPVLVSGGARSFLLGEFAPGVDWIEAPELVHAGLLAAAGA